MQEGGVSIYGDLGVSGTVIEASDRRLKREVTSLESSLTKLTAVSGYHYYWKDPTKSTRLQTGVIAQELEEIFPELVITGKDGYKSVNYTGLIPHLIESVKELHKKNEAVAKLEKDVADMKLLIVAMKETLNEHSLKTVAK